MAKLGDIAFSRLMEIIKGDDAAVIKLSNGDVVLVDHSDYQQISAYNWYKHGSYAARKCGGKVILMHRAIMDAPPGMMVDHADGDELNNQRHNLRLCTHAENMRNRKPVGKSSKYKGVQFVKGKWVAVIRANGIRTRLGSYCSQLNAAKAYDCAAKKLHGEFAKTNKDLGLY